MSISLKVNGERRVFQGEPLTPLIDVLRDELFLTGAKAVCREGFCGACMVHIDGVPAVSCLTPVGLVEDREIVTVEGLSADGGPTPLQQAFENHDVVQCGMCFPGMMMTLTHFLGERPEATRADVKAALVGNICRCTGYERIVDAALSRQMSASSKERTC